LRRIGTTLAPGLTSSPSTFRKSVPPRRSRCWTQTPPADDLRAARHWHLQRALALIALNRPGAAGFRADAPLA
jgi:hypothetical protein